MGESQNLHDTLGGGDGSPPLGDVVLSQNQLSLPGTTLDLSDIKWGILEPVVGVVSAATVKRSASAAEQERLTIQQEEL